MIKITQSDREIYINPLYIEFFSTRGKYTRIYMHGDDDDEFYDADQSPEEILDLIKTSWRKL